MVEFRMPLGFDQGLPRPGVFIRKYLDEHTVIQSSNLASFVQDWQAGETSTIRAGKSLIKSEPPTWEGLFLDIVSIDPHTSQALIRVRAGAPLPSELGGVTVLVTLGGVGTGGGGWVILPSGKVKKIPPQDPLREIVSLLGIAASVDEIEESEDAGEIRQSAVSALRRLAELDVPTPSL